MFAVTVTLATTLTGQHYAITVSVDPQPVPLRGSGDHDVEWTLDDTSYDLGWRFASQGIDIKAPRTVFKNKKGSGAGKKHGWKSLTFDTKEYRYTINLENLDTGDQLSWDPTIMN